MRLIPHEHGAYGQVAFPMLTALAVAGPSVPALLVAAALVGGFLGHEPLLVLLGRRGSRAQRDHGMAARRWLGAAGSVAVVAGAAAVMLAPASARWTFVLPMVPAALLALAIATAREKTAGGEAAAALAFSFAAAPLASASGAAANVGLVIAAVFGSIFVSQTLAVRAVILKVRGGGDPGAVRTVSVVVLVLAAASAIALALAARADGWPAIGLAAALPGLAVAAGLVLRPPRPTRLRTVGWTLVATSAAAVIILVAGLRG